MPGPVEPDANAPPARLERRFSVPLDAGGLPLPAATRPAAAPAAPRDLWLRVSLFAVLLGAVLTVLYAWFVLHPDIYAGAPAFPAEGLQRILVPILAVVAVAGALILERAAALGVVLMLVGTGLGLTGGAIWLVPGAVLGCIWAAPRRAGARTTLGFLLLIPGVAASYYGLVGGIGYATGLEVRGLPPALAQPLSLGQAMQPLELLPIAVLGAWLLIRPLRGKTGFR